MRSLFWLWAGPGLRRGCSQRETLAALTIGEGYRDGSWRDGRIMTRYWTPVRRELADNWKEGRHMVRVGALLEKMRRYGSCRYKFHPGCKSDPVANLRSGI